VQGGVPERAYEKSAGMQITEVVKTIPLHALHGLPPVEIPKNGNKLTRRAKTNILAMLAMGYTSRTVVIWLNKNHGIKVSRQDIDSIRNRQRKRIGDCGGRNKQEGARNGTGSLEVTAPNDTG